MQRGFGFAWGAFVSVSAAVVTVPACSSSSSQDSCAPPPESCDEGEASMHVYDATRDCLGAVTTLAGTCATSVDRCTESGGIGVVCAVSASGVAYTAVGTDNVLLTGTGWQFELPLSSIATADSVARREEVSGQAIVLCARAMCAPACPGVTLEEWQHLNCLDAGSR